MICFLPIKWFLFSVLLHICIYYFILKAPSQTGIPSKTLLAQHLIIHCIILRFFQVFSKSLKIFTKESSSESMAQFHHSSNADIQEILPNPQTKKQTHTQKWRSPSCIVSTSWKGNIVTFLMNKNIIWKSPNKASFTMSYGHWLLGSLLSSKILTDLSIEWK